MSQPREDSEQLGNDNNEAKNKLYTPMENKGKKDQNSEKDSLLQTDSQTKLGSKQQKAQYRIFLILGIGSLLPFNCVIVPVDFWMKFYDSIFLSAASLSYNAGNWLIVLLMLVISSKINQVKTVPICLGVFLVALIIIPLIHVIISDVTAKTYVTLIPVIICGISNGFFFPIILEIAQRLNPINAQAFMAGQGIAGLIPQAILIVIKAIISFINIEEKDKDQALFIQTLTYFIIGSIFIIVCFIAWFQLKKFIHSEPLLEKEEAIKVKVSIKHTLKLIWKPVLSIFLIFAVTLAIFPTIIAPIPCNYLARDNKLGTDNGWWNIGVMTTFMIFDYVGRSIVVFKWAQKISLQNCLFISIGRLLFFALFLLEALPKYVCKEHCDQGPIIKVDELTILTMILFALSNGWVSSSIMMKYSQCLNPDEPDYQANLQQASVIQSIALNSGLFTGGLLSLAIAIPFQ